MRNLDEPFSALVKLLGEENAEDLKKRLCDLIVNRVDRDIRNYSGYLLYPPDAIDLTKNAVKDTQKKLEAMYRDAVIEINQDYINKMKEYMSKQVDDPEKTMRREIIDLAKILSDASSYSNREYGRNKKLAAKLFEIAKATEEEMEQ